MTAYVPTTWSAPLHEAVLMVFVLATGAWIVRLKPKPRARRMAWSIVVVGVAVAERVSATEPPGFRMLAIVGTLLLAMKGVVGVETAWSGGEQCADRLPTGWRWFCFAVGWPGMRPELFRDLGAAPAPGGWAQIVRGLERTTIGVVCVAVARSVNHASTSPVYASATVLSLVGLSLILHFGLFNILAGIWRLAGVPCEPQFRAPLRALSLTEFWGKRWNIAFSDMTRRAIYLPLRERLGHPWAVTVAFLVSGILHELAISLPVQAGYGLPFGYFLLHAVVMRIERLPLVRSCLENPLTGRVWTIVWLLLPLPILFHPPFLRGVVSPIVGG